MNLPLHLQHCRPLDAAQGHHAMDAAQIAAHLAQVPGWALVDGAIEKSYRFDDFHRTIGFVNAVAFVCNREDHHPDLAVSYGRCTVRFNTHSLGGVSTNDFICAAMVDALLNPAA
ncbi:MAG: 4a-hydroxytetrahydrobiopterin dehydratase [Burkholderiaceae bacterium]|nr:4a-hydroxytetrahydrobiopterin dehydratase [Burkholderiaceae bacterium]